MFDAVARSMKRLSWLAPLTWWFRRKPKAASLLAPVSPISGEAPDDLDFAPPPVPAPAPEAGDVAVSAPALLEASPEPAPAPAPLEPAPLAFAPPEAYAAAAPVLELEDEEEVRDFEEEAAAEIEPLDDDAGPSLDVRVLEALAEIPAQRARARIEALAGEHRIALTDAAGPGSLAEALIALEREGAVTCRLVEDAAGQPCLSYAPRTAGG